MKPSEFAPVNVGTIRRLGTTPYGVKVVDLRGYMSYSMLKHGSFDLVESQLRKAPQLCFRLLWYLTERLDRKSHDTCVPAVPKELCKVLHTSKSPLYRALHALEEADMLRYTAKYTVRMNPHVVWAGETVYNPLACMLWDGLITQDEYDRRYAQLLAR